MNKIKTFTEKHTDTDINKFSEQFPKGELIKMYGKLKYIYSDEFLEKPTISFRGNGRVSIHLQIYSGDENSEKHDMVDVFEINNIHIFEKFIMFTGSFESEIQSIFLDQYGDFYRDTDQQKPLNHSDFLCDYNQPILFRSDFTYCEYTRSSDFDEATEKYKHIDHCNSITFDQAHDALYNKPCYCFGFNEIYLLAKILELDKYNSDLVYDSNSKKIIKDYSLNRK